MRRVLCVSIVALLSSVALLAQKAAAASSGVVVLSPVVIAPPSHVVTTGFVPVLTTTIKPPGGKDLFITVSAQTLAFVQSSNESTTKSTETAGAAAIQMRVLLDGVPIPVGVPPATSSIITFDNQFHELAQITTFTDSLTLVTEDGGAHSFSWIARGVGVGNHTITVEARFVLSDSTFAGVAAHIVAAASEALIGPRTLTVEQVALDAQ